MTTTSVDAPTPAAQSRRAYRSGIFAKIHKIRSIGMLAFLLALLFCIPILIILSASLMGASDNWQHLANTLLPTYVTNSLLLMLGVGIGVIVLGLPAAWLTSVCEFWGRKVLSWALLLPLALPAYIIAYTYTGLLDFAGPVQTFIREITGATRYGEYWFPEVRSLGGAVVMMSLVLYPYVYLLARAAFIEQSVCVLEASRSLGCNPRQAFFRVALPLARPAVITGLSLALMESLADYGTVAFFGVSTFTTGIFRAWAGIGDEIAMAQLASVLMLFVIMLVILERISRRQSRFHHTTNRYSTITRHQLKGRQVALAWLVCGLPILLGFLIPMSVLLYWSVSMAEPLNASFYKLIWHTLSLGAIAALLAVILALIVAYAQRNTSSWLVRTATGLISMGYALPGLVVAIGVMIAFGWLDHRLIDVMESWFDVSPGLIFSGSVMALLYAYMVRFLSISINTVSSGLGKIKPSMDDAGRSMGLSAFGVLRQVHAPLMKSTILTAYLLVFVDVLKELPATIILRPLNFNTLAVRAHEMASDERLIDAGPPALMIVLVGLLPVILLSRGIAKGRAGHDSDPKVNP